MVPKPLRVAIACNRPAVVRATWAWVRAPTPVGTRCRLIVTLVIGPFYLPTKAVVGIGFKRPSALAVSLIVSNEFGATSLQLLVVDPVDQLKGLIKVVLRWAALFSIGGELVTCEVLLVVDLPSV